MKSNSGRIMWINFKECCRYFMYPQRGFEIVMWIAIAMCVMVGIGNTWNFKSAWDVMIGERQQLELRIDVLQEYVTEDAGQSFD